MSKNIFFLPLILSMLSAPALFADRLSSGSGETRPFRSSLAPDEGAMKTVNDMEGAQPIVEPFKKHFDKCAMKGSNGSESKASVQGQCTFQDMGINRDIHVGKPSCHHKGEAIDVGKINCGGRELDPQKEKESYMEIAKCLATEATEEGGENAFKVIYMDATPVENMMVGHTKGMHEDHMHIQLKTCSTSGNQVAGKR